MSGETQVIAARLTERTHLNLSSCLGTASHVHNADNGPRHRPTVGSQGGRTLKTETLLVRVQVLGLRVAEP